MIYRPASAVAGLVYITCMLSFDTLHAAGFAGGAFTGRISFVAGKQTRHDPVRPAGDANALFTLDGAAILPGGIQTGIILEGELDAARPAYFYDGGRYRGFPAGGPGGGGPAGSDIYLRSARVYAKGAFGKIIAGRGEGVARSLSVISPTIFEAVNVNDWKTDLTGLNDVHTVNDFTGYAPRITWMIPGNLFGGFAGGLQAGFSRALHLKGTDNPPPAGDADSGGKRVSAWEAALYYEKKILPGRQSPVAGLAVSYVRAPETDGSTSAKGRYSAWTTGLNIAYGEFTIGGSVKMADTLSVRGGKHEYTALDAGLVYRAGNSPGDRSYMLSYGHSVSTGEDLPSAPGTSERRTRVLQAGASLLLRQESSIGVAVQHLRSSGYGQADGSAETTAFLVEYRLRFRVPSRDVP